MSSEEHCADSWHLMQADECHTVFGLDASDELMEDFVASLAQTYACAHNSLTPSREVRRQPH